MLVDPVKLMPRTRRSLISALPQTLPAPVMRLSAPAGSPASLNSSTRRAAAHGVWLAVFSTTVQPKAERGGQSCAPA